MQEEQSSRFDGQSTNNPAPVKTHVWTNMQYLLSSIPASQQSQAKPQERWGHASICAHDRKMFIIGGYQGKPTTQNSMSHPNPLGSGLAQPFPSGMQRQQTGVTVNAIPPALGSQSFLTAGSSTAAAQARESATTSSVTRFGASLTQEQLGAQEALLRSRQQQALVNCRALIAAGSSSSAFDLTLTGESASEGLQAAALSATFGNVSQRSHAGGNTETNNSGGEGVTGAGVTSDSTYTEEGGGSEVATEANFSSTTQMSQRLSVDQQLRYTAERSMAAVDGFSSHQSSTENNLRDKEEIFLPLITAPLQEQSQEMIDYTAEVETDDLQQAIAQSQSQSVSPPTGEQVASDIQVPPPVPFNTTSENPYLMNSEELNEALSHLNSNNLNSNAINTSSSAEDLQSDSVGQLNSDNSSPYRNSFLPSSYSSTVSPSTQQLQQLMLLDPNQNLSPLSLLSLQAAASSNANPPFSNGNVPSSGLQLQYPAHPISNVQQLAPAPVSSVNLGQYLGDIWEFDFTKCAYLKHKAFGEDAHLLERSNHTAVFYEPHNAIYVFGGGQAQRLRFNDTLKLVLPQSYRTPQQDPSQTPGGTGNLFEPEPVTQVSVLVPREGSPMPSPRTYHASCLIGKFMIVSGGEANNTDLSDMWALNLEESYWCRLEINAFGQNTFVSKRFHTVSAMSKNRLVSFGGCHSEYVHLNDVNVFDLDAFIKSDGSNCQVQCVKLDFRGPASTLASVPSTRWGHAASVFEDKLFILGGRNNDDINDLHCFDLNKKLWSQVEIGHPMPKPRRRHSAVFVSSTLVMFGGFDGEFFNDFHMLHFGQQHTDSLMASKVKNAATIGGLLEDYAKLVNSKEHSNLKFLIDGTTPGAPAQVIHANKSLVLFRLFEREVREYCQDSRVFQMRMEEVLTCPQTRSMCPQFFQRVFDAKPGQILRFPGICSYNEFLLFLEFCYCDRLVQPVTGAQIAAIRQICQVLGLATVTQYFDSLAQHVRNKLQAELVKDFEAKLTQQLSGATGATAASLLDNNGNPVSNLTVEQRLELERSVQELFETIKFNFNQLDGASSVVQSPEDRIEKQNHIIHSEMAKCRNLDHFFDVVFELDGNHLMRANSAVLHTRCEYFRIMFDSKYGFQESTTKECAFANSENDQTHPQTTGVRYVVVKGIPKQYFTAIIQFLYTDNFCQTECNLAFFLRLLIYADYFMIGKLAELCQDILKQFVKPKNVMDLYLVAHAHNAAKLERFCINFLAVNLHEVQKGTQWKDFQRKCRQFDRHCLLTKVQDELEKELSRNFVAISVQRHVQKMAKADWPRFEFGQVQIDPTNSGTIADHTSSRENTHENQENSSQQQQTIHGVIGAAVPQTPPRTGITLLTTQVAHSRLTSKPLKTGHQGNKRSPSNRRDTLPTIVKVATGVTSRIVEPSSSGLMLPDTDLEQIMSVPNYIYFEEHFPTETYGPLLRPSQSVIRPLMCKQIESLNSNFELEEIKDEGFSSFKRPHPLIGNFMQRERSLREGSEESENQDPNVRPATTMISTTGWRSYKQNQTEKSKPTQAAATNNNGSQQSEGVRFGPFVLRDLNRN